MPHNDIFAMRDSEVRVCRRSFPTVFAHSQNAGPAPTLSGPH